MVQLYWARLLLGCFYIILILGVLRGERSLSDYLELKQKKQLLEVTVHRLETQLHELKQEIYRLENSPEYAQKILRDKYHILAADEQMIFFEN